MDSEVKPARSVARIVKWVALGAVVVVALVFGGRWLAWRLGHVVTDAGFVRADVVEVAPEVPAHVARVLVKEGDLVQAGQVLVELDDREYRDRLQIAEADVRVQGAAAGLYEAKLQLAQGDVPAVIRAAEAAVDAAKQVEAQARAQEGYLAKQRQRFAALLEQKAIGRARFDEIDAQCTASHAAAEAAAAQVRAAQGKLAEARSSRSKIAEAAAGLAQSKEGLARAQQGMQLAQTMQARTRLVAPIAGVVARRFLEPGDFAAPGRPAIALYDPSGIYVEARFEETKLAHLRAGQRVTLTFDALPGHDYHGRVRLIHRASAGEFALIPRDVTAGEFTKLTQRVPVEIDIDGDIPRGQLVPGLSVAVAAPKHGRDES